MLYFMNLAFYLKGTAAVTKTGQRNRKTFMHRPYKIAYISQTTCEMQHMYEHG